VVDTVSGEAGQDAVEVGHAELTRRSG